MNFIRDAVTGYFRREWTITDLVNDLEPGDIARKHLVQVYTTLALVFMVAANGSFLAWKGDIDRSSALNLAVMSFLLFYFTQLGQNIKYCLLLSTAFFGGASFVPRSIMLRSPDSGVLVSTQLVGVALHLYSLRFSCEGNRQTWILSWCVAAHVRALCAVAAWRLAAAAIWGFHLLKWFVFVPAFLAPYMLLVLHAYPYSYGIALRARDGDTDFVNHAMAFFTEFPAIHFNLGVTSVIMASRWIRDTVRM